jgi:hypothetical protein
LLVLLFKFRRGECEEGMYRQTHTLSLIQRLLPNSDFSLDLILVLATFIRLHALGIVVPQQPRDLLAPAGGERMREDLNIGLVLCEHALEKVAWKCQSIPKEKCKHNGEGRVILPLRG